MGPNRSPGRHPHHLCQGKAFKPTLMNLQPDDYQRISPQYHVDSTVPIASCQLQTVELQEVPKTRCKQNCA